jgi:thiamine monophosphate synthase
MLQFIASPHPTISLTEQVQAAIAAGCGWVQLSMPASATDDEVAAAAAELIPLCREAGTIMVIEERTQVVKDTLVHGVVLPLGADAAQVREFLGPHAIIGCHAASAAEIISLEKLDVDYAIISAAADVAEIVGQVRAAGLNEYPVVVRLEPAASLAEAESHTAAGANAVALHIDALNERD